MSTEVDAPVTVAPKRLYFADNLRVALVALVVLHHLSIVYAGNTSFYYVDFIGTKLATGGFTVFAAMFQLLNQAYFMGLLFFLAGYFTPASFERKGPALFFKDRLIRLGIPLVVFMFILGPLSSIGSYTMPQSITHLPALSWSQYPHMIAMGPLWFAALLLIFDVLYVLWRTIRRNAAEGKSWAPGFWAICLFIIALAIVSYFMRMAVPIATYVLNFPSLAYLPQYLSFFVLGAILSHRDWLSNVPSRYGIVGFIVAIVSLILFLVGISAKYGTAAGFLGHGTFQSGVYALWDSIFSVCMGLALIVFFRRFFNHTHGFGRFVQGNSFAVYVIHCPLIVLICGLLLHPLTMTWSAKFLLAAVITVPVVFLVAGLIRKIPGVKKVL